MKILAVIGTRPEAIKVAPVIKKMKKDLFFDIRLCITGQHREMLDQVMEIFNLKANYDLKVMASHQTLSDITCRVIDGLNSIFREYKPDVVMVHGDTTTSFSAATAAFYSKIPLAHIEAGLRTYNRYSPWPEEMNRCLISKLADIHFAPTVKSAENLKRENIPESSVVVTGNTVIDALFLALEYIDSNEKILESMEQRFGFLKSDKKLILITSHRRENHGEGLVNICKALKELSARDDIKIVYPVHLNPIVQNTANKILSNVDNVHLIEPMDYLSFIYLMRKSYLILTDSGGIQEEGPSLGKPILVMRDTTERSEAVNAGTVCLVGTDKELIVKKTSILLDSEAEYKRMSEAHNPYGDGLASERILNEFKLNGKRLLI